jgi:sugar transferase (PEP-CTERM/EpsH1 system associated)
MRLLMLTHRLPYAPNRGDRIRSYHLLRALGAQHEVHLVSLVHDDEEASHAGNMRDLAAHVSVARVSRSRTLARAPFALPGATPLTHVLLDSPQVRPLLTQALARFRPELVIAYCSGMAKFALEPPLDRLPYVLDMVDVDSQKWSTLAARTAGPRRWIFNREARVLGRFEAVATRRAQFTTVVNARERDSLRTLAPDARVHVVPNGIDLAAFSNRALPATEPRVVFSGVLDYAPNEQGALWMAEIIWPIVRAARPDARLVLLGANPTAAIRRLPERDRSIEVTGTVPAVQPYLWSSAVAVVPLATARGLQNKVLEALAAGLPVVVTPIVRDGLPADVASACSVAADPERFAAAVIDLLARTPQERRALAGRAPLQPLGWSAQLKPFLDLLRAREPSRLAHP